MLRTAMQAGAYALRAGTALQAGIRGYTRAGGSLPVRLGRGSPIWMANCPWSA
ncbi:MAG: hypothetical protein V1929_13725 [bacterium]